MKEDNPMYIILIILFFVIIGGYFLVKYSITKFVENLKEIEKEDDDISCK